MYNLLILLYGENATALHFTTVGISRAVIHTFLCYSPLLLLHKNHHTPVIFSRHFLLGSYAISIHLRSRILVYFLFLCIYLFIYCGGDERWRWAVMVVIEVVVCVYGVGGSPGGGRWWWKSMLLVEEDGRYIV